MRKYDREETRKRKRIIESKRSCESDIFREVVGGRRREMERQWEREKVRGR